MNNLVQTDKSPSADKQHVGGIDLNEFLVRVLATALGRNIGNGSFQNLQQGLLNTLTGDVPGDGWVFVFFGDLVDLIDVNDSLHAAVTVPSGRLQQFENDVFDIFSNIARLGQGGGVHNGKGNRKHAGQCLSQQGLARSGGSNQQHITLGQLNILMPLAAQLDPLVVIVNGNAQLLLADVLTDHVLLKEVLDLSGLGEGFLDGGSFGTDVIRDDLVANIYAFVADKDRRTGDQFFDVILALVAK